VPHGTSTTDLLNNLVSALLPSAGQPKSTLLKTAARTFPARATLVNVTQAGTTAVVNLGGLKGASTTALEQVSAQLAWTLASPPFTSHGQVWSRCAAEASVQRGQVGPVVSVLGSATVASLPSCGEGNVPTGSIAAPVSRPCPGLGTPALVAVSPDGQYVACYSPDAGKLFTGPASGGTTKLTAVKEIGSGVTALSWDRNHDLWVAENGDVFMVPVNGQTTSVNTSALPGNVTDLSVAPDGILIALIVQNGASSVGDLAAIIHGGPFAQRQPSEAVSPTEPAVPLGPALVQPEDLTWYDADNLIVLTGGSSPRLSEVPVDGQQSYNSQLAPPGTDSITANSEMNALVAGLPGEQLAVSTSIEGPWQFLGVHGQNPAYPG